MKIMIGSVVIFASRNRISNCGDLNFKLLDVKL